MKIDMKALIEIARDAGEKIMTIYNASGDIEVEYKNDESPLTKADTASHTVINQGLKTLYPQIPIISEEGKNITHEAPEGLEFFLAG